LIEGGTVDVVVERGADGLAEDVSFGKIKASTKMIQQRKYRHEHQSGVDFLIDYLL